MGIGIGIGNRINGLGSLYPSVATIGNIYSEDFVAIGTNQLSHYTKSGTSVSWFNTVNGISATTTGAPTTSSDCQIYNQFGDHKLQKISGSTSFSPTIKNASSVGVTTVIKCVDPLVANYDIAFFCNTSTGLECILAIYSNNVTMGTQATTLAFNANDTLKMDWMISGGTAYMQIFNVTSGTSKARFSATLCTFTAGTELMPQQYRVGFGVRGGNHLFKNFSVGTPAQKNVDYCFIGHSIPSGYNAGSVQASWPDVAMSGTGKSYTKLTVPSSTIFGALNCFQEIALINARTYVLQDYRNDLARGRTDAQWKADYTTMYNYIKNTLGKKVIIVTPIPSTVDVSSGVTYLSTYGSGTDKFINLYNTSLLGTGTTMVSHYGGDVWDDGVHPGPSGHTMLGNLVRPYIT